jgi:hypothetical protein
MMRHRNSTGQTSFQASMKANLTGFGLQRRLPPFLALPSPRAKAGLPCEGGCSPSQRLHAVLTSDRRADVAEPTCSTSKAQRPNLMKPVAVPPSLSRCASKKSFEISMPMLSFVIIVMSYACHASLWKFQLAYPFRPHAKTAIDLTHRRSITTKPTTIQPPPMPIKN